MKKKAAITVVALALVLCFAIGGTFAWLVDTSDEVVNTFTYGDIDIDLTETTGEEYKMIPGNDIQKDPTVTVKKDSEACWLFVKVIKSDNYDTYLDNYTIAEGWTPLDGVEGVYYREVDAETAKAGEEYAVLNENKVTVLERVTKTDMEAIKTNPSTKPILTFTAYAVQKDGFETAADAWTAINPN